MVGVVSAPASRAVPPERMTASRKATLMLCVVLLVGVLLGVVGEGVVRLRHWWRYGNLWSVEDTFQIDRATGLRVPTPNAVKGRIRINSLGFRSPELTVPKPPSTIRLAFLGGSTTYCAEVTSNELTWPHLVWQRLQIEFPDRSLDYVNAGVPGYALDSILKSFEHRVSPLQPDVVVIYEATNDLSFDTYELAKSRHLVFHRPDESRSWLSQHSFLWFLVTKNLTILQRQVQADIGTDSLTFDPHELSQGFRRRLTELVRASRASASMVAVATFSPRLRRDLSPAERRNAAVTSLYYMPYMSIDGLLQGFEEYNRVIREVARDTGALLIEGEDRIPPDARHYTDSVHFSDAGSRAMATRVSEALLADPGFRMLVVSKEGQARRP
jgi:lysophospholipase L1-like esterase